MTRSSSYLEKLPDNVLLQVFNYIPMHRLVPAMRKRSQRLRFLVFSDANVKARLQVVDGGAVDADPLDTAGKWRRVFLIAETAAKLEACHNPILWKPSDPRYLCPFCGTTNMAFRTHDHSFRCELCCLWLDYHGYCKGKKLVFADTDAQLLLECRCKLFDLRANLCTDCAKDTPPPIE